MSRLLANTILAERRRGCIFAEDFINSSRVEQNGGAITGSPTINNSVVFDGTNNKYIDYTANNPFKNGQPADMTFMFRFTPNQPELAGAKGLIQGGEANNSFPVITTLNGKMIYYANSSQFRYSATELVAGRRYHVAVTTDGTIANTKIYVDGKLDNGTSNTASGSPVPWTFLMLGKRGLLGTTYFGGELEELKIFERQLTPMEIYSDYKQDSEFEDIVYQDLDNSKWGDTANITKEQLPTFQGATDVMKITATSTTSITITNSNVPIEVGMLYKATLRVWVPSTDGGVAWYWDTSIDGNPRQTTTLTDQWVDLDIFFIGASTSITLYLNPASNGKSVYVDSLIVSKYNSQECDVDLRFRPEDFDGTSVKNHADATNPFIADGALPKQLKYGGMKFDGSTTGLVSTNALNNKWHQVENFIVAFRKEQNATNSYLFANRDTAGGGLSIIFSETTGKIENYVGTTVLLTSPYYSINVLIIQRVFNAYYVYNNGVYVGTTVKGGTNIYGEGKNLWIGKRGGSTALRFKGDILRLKHTYGYMNEKAVQKCTYDFLRSVKGGELL